MLQLNSSKPATLLFFFAYRVEYLIGFPFHFNEIFRFQSCSAKLKGKSQAKHTTSKSARPQRQTNAKGCRVFGDLDQLKSEDTMEKTVD